MQESYYYEHEINDDNSFEIYKTVAIASPDLREYDDCDDDMEIISREIIFKGVVAHEYIEKINDICEAIIEVLESEPD